MAHLETHGRSLAKTISWRVFASAIALAVFYMTTGDIGIAALGTALVAFVNTITYYFHERFWNHLHWGKRSKR